MPVILRQTAIIVMGMSNPLPGSAPGVAGVRVVPHGEQYLVILSYLTISLTILLFSTVCGHVPTGPDSSLPHTRHSSSSTRTILSGSARALGARLRGAASSLPAPFLAAAAPFLPRALGLILRFLAERAELVFLACASSSPSRLTSSPYGHGLPPCAFPHACSFSRPISLRCFSISSFSRPISLPPAFFFSFAISFFIFAPSFLSFAFPFASFLSFAITLPCLATVASRDESSLASLATVASRDEEALPTAFSPQRSNFAICQK